MIEMHWVIFVLALLACGAGGWVARGRTEKGYRRAVERENEVLREEASEFYNGSCLRSKKLESISLKACYCIPRNEVEMFGLKSTLERASNEVTDKIAEDVRESIKAVAGIDRMGNVRTYAELRVLKPEEEEL